MKPRYFISAVFGALLFTLATLPLSVGPAVASGGVEDSYHGQLGYGTGHGMLEKWCALPNFSYYQQDGIDGWTKQSCNKCHIGASWNPTRDEPLCTYCHASASPVIGDAEGAKIYPFNAVTVDWYVKSKDSDFDEVIIVPEVKAADADGDGLVTLKEMQKDYRKAVLKTADVNFSISHSVVPVSQAFVCNDCHGRQGWVLDWNQLGYTKDPRGNKKGGKKPK